eukprot:EG_transcript_11830
MLIRLTPLVIVNRGLFPAPSAMANAPQHFAAVFSPLFGLAPPGAGAGPGQPEAAAAVARLAGRPHAADPRQAAAAAAAALRWVADVRAQVRIRGRRYVAARRVLRRFVARVIAARRRRLLAGLREWTAFEAPVGDSLDGSAERRPKILLKGDDHKLTVLSRMHREHCHALLKELRPSVVAHRDLSNDVRALQRRIASQWLGPDFRDIELLQLLGRCHELHRMLVRPLPATAPQVDAGWRAVCRTDWGAVAKAYRLELARSKPKGAGGLEELLAEGGEMLRRLQGLAAQHTLSHMELPTTPAPAAPPLQREPSASPTTPGTPPRRSPTSRAAADPQEVVGSSAHVRRIASLRSPKGADAPHATVNILALTVSPSQRATSPTRVADQFLARRLRRPGSAKLLSPKQGDREGGFAVMGQRVSPGKSPSAGPGAGGPASPKGAPAVGPLSPSEPPPSPPSPAPLPL